MQPKMRLELELRVAVNAEGLMDALIAQRSIICGVPEDPIERQVRRQSLGPRDLIRTGGIARQRPHLPRERSGPKENATLQPWGPTHRSRTETSTPGSNHRT